jgi:prevent-host-death family protein
MKTVTLEEAENNFSAVIRLVRSGQEVQLTSRKKPVARILPVARKRRKTDWSNTWARVDAIFGRRPARGKPGSQIIAEGRR